ncbi:MAG TPA: isochorismatase family cysteine hydrolase [Gemmatimonadaceae bacterium]|nr:isochorismatase family cysteine hydrolase [Gemmatimonadaceae bacterium]
MRALIVVDVQNEFSPSGLRPVPNHASALAAIQRWVDCARAEGWAIAWVQHHNRPDESRAFVPGSWGAEFSPELELRLDQPTERHFQKDVYGAFTATGLEEWLRAQGVEEVLVVGFYAHMCLSTTVREALVRGFRVSVDPTATGARDLEHDELGRQTADDVRRSALLQLENMGASVVSSFVATGSGLES